MQRTINNLIGYSMKATDGEIGKVQEFYFDDQTWTIRYLILKTGIWLSGREVLISPGALVKQAWEDGTFPVDLTKEQIRNSPDIDTDKPVFRSQEIKLYGHYPWQPYWGGGLYTGGIWNILEPPSSEEDKPAENDQHLRSTHEVTGYHIHASDGAIGHVTDFIIDDQAWSIIYLIIDTHNWFGGKKVLVHVRDIKEVKWDSSEVVLNLPIVAIKNSPSLDESGLIHQGSGKVTHIHIPLLTDEEADI